MVYSTDRIPDTEDLVAERRIDLHFSFDMKQEYSKMCGFVWDRMWIFPRHLCSSLLLLRCLHRGVWVITAIY